MSKISNAEIQERRRALCSLERPSSSFSNKVTIVSFIMAIFVISIHANNLKYYGMEATTYSLVYQEVKIISEIMGGIAVPFFFMLSGYWFFRMDIISPDVWNKVKIKIKRKTKTLIIPYLLWNAFGTVFYMAITRIPILARQMNGVEIIPISLKTIGEGVLLHEFYFTFWYMRDLIIIIFVLAPPMLLLLRNIALTSICLVVLCTLSCMGSSFTWLETPSVLLFFIGGILAVYCNRVFEQKQSKKIAAGCIAALLICCVIRYFDLPIISNLCLYISPLLMWKSFDLIDFHKAYWFEHQSFFIYAAHVIPVTVLGHILTKICTSPLWAAVAYFIAIGVALGFIYMIAKMLNKYLSRIYGVICGSR